MNDIKTDLLFDVLSEKERILKESPPIQLNCFHIL